ncbi:FAD-dependent oxidoreductase [Porticoccus sp. W117]|uniref:NAD(P)/FAD-dependent oxidoreductase n=1 Tax=Porticoccus sp. W117 TaxID=3054777 RepID=UPI002591FD14|nr:FAD-dependent oxidoreductase [Porticoccus sp. W117]MDM3872488.1 FAD-dependent oxidoreductase [Porticoccus sp. W117]
MDIAVVGAGLAGLTVAHGLIERGNVTVFEKSRGVGGRMSTRRAEPFAFDHGAQFFRARGDRFKVFLSPMMNQGVVQPWEGRFVDIHNRQANLCSSTESDIARYVCAPGMSAMAKHLRQQLSVQLQTRVGSIAKEHNQWVLTDDQGASLGVYDWVIFAAPAEQTAELLPAESSCYQTVASIRMQACFSLMLGFDQPLELGFDGATVHGEDISWIALNHTKPGRAQAFSVMAHSSNQWAGAHIDDDRDEVMSHLSQQLGEILGIDVNQASHNALHGWRYANALKQTGEPCLVDAEHQIGVCGDWLIEGKVEAAFSSGDALAQALIDVL